MKSSRQRLTGYCRSFDPSLSRLRGRTPMEERRSRNHDEKSPAYPRDNRANTLSEVIARKNICSKNIKHQSIAQQQRE